MSDLTKQARRLAFEEETTRETQVVLLALCAVIDGLRYDIGELEIKYRKAEYNYASTKLEQARKAHGKD